MLTKIRQFAVVKGGAGFPHEDQGALNHPLPFYKVAALGEASVEGYLQDAANTITEETALALGARVFPAGTVTFAKVGEALKLNRFCLLKERACLDNNMMGLILDSQKAHPRFVRYALGTRDMSELVNPGAVPSVNGSQVGNMLVWLPSPETQSTIANYLDAKTAAIDAVIAKKELLTEELKKYQEAVIAEAVRPREGWRSYKVKQLFKALPKSSVPSGAGDEAGTVPFYVSGEETKRVTEAMYTGTALLLADGGKATLHLAEGAFSWSDHVVCLVSSNDVATEFVYNQLSIQRELLDGLGFRGTGLPMLDKRWLHEDLPIWLPKSRAETVALNASIRATRERVRELTGNLQSTVQELRRLRAAIISEAVTGKLKLSD